MFNISGFFNKFRSLELDDFRKRSAVIDIVKKITGIEIQPQNIKFEQGRIVLSASSIEKNEIFIKKSSILQEIQQIQSLGTVTDII